MALGFGQRGAIPWIDGDETLLGTPRRPSIGKRLVAQIRRSHHDSPHGPQAFDGVDRIAAGALPEWLHGQVTFDPGAAPLVRRSVGPSRSS